MELVNSESICSVFLLAKKVSGYSPLQGNCNYKTTKAYYHWTCQILKEHLQKSLP